MDKKESSPTLNTILMVEQTLQNTDESAIKVAELKRRLPKQVNHNTLMTILDYLEKSNKIVVGLKGITWTRNTNKKLLKMLEEEKNFDEWAVDFGRRIKKEAYEKIKNQSKDP